MSGIDEDLRNAVLESEADEAARPVVVSPEAPTRSKPRKELGLLIALLVMGGSILALVMTSFNDAAIYSKGVDEVVQHQAELSSKNLRVQGTLVKGTLVRRESPCEYRFRMQKNGSEIAVSYQQCVVPDTFRDVPEMDVDVTATGKLAADGHFQASEIMAKCPSKYDMKQRAASGEKAPHGSMFPAPAPAAKAN
jgi:cytochrome c-type biogenesis protein CcmE